MGNVILFPSGSEFMVCKRKQEGKILHVYLREIKTGIGEDVLLWCD